MTVRGSKVLVHESGNYWRVDNRLLERSAKALAFRSSKRDEDKLEAEAKYGSIVEGIDGSDGWLQVQVLNQDAWLSKGEALAGRAVEICTKKINDMLGRAYRVAGVIKCSRILCDPEYKAGSQTGPQHELKGEEAVGDLKRSIVEFENAVASKDFEQVADKWCAVAFWNVYCFYSRFRGRPDIGLPWLKHAVRLYEKIKGVDQSDHHSEKYRSELAYVLGKTKTDLSEKDLEEKDSIVRESLYAVVFTSLRGQR